MAALLAALVLPIGILASNVVAIALKGSNPAQVDVTQGLAYLREILLTAIATIGALAIAAGVLGVVGARSPDPEERRPGRLGLLVLVLVMVAIVALAISNVILQGIVERAS